MRVKTKLFIYLTLSLFPTMLIAGIGSDSSWRDDGVGYSNGSIWIFIPAVIVVLIASIYARYVIVVVIAFILCATLSMWFGYTIGIISGLAFLLWLHKSSASNHQMDKNIDTEENYLDMQVQFRNESETINTKETYVTYHANEYKISKGISSREGDNLIKRDKEIIKEKVAKNIQIENNSHERESRDNDFLKTRIKTRE